MTEMTEMVLPQHANALGTAFGGTVMSWIDICAAVTAQRHSGRIAVTAAIDELTFLAPIRVGDVVCLTGRINQAFRSSVEVEVSVAVENSMTRERRPCADALLTFVNVDDSGKPMPMPPLSLTTDEELHRAQQAQKRRDERLARKKKTP